MSLIVPGLQPYSYAMGAKKQKKRPRGRPRKKTTQVGTQKRGMFRTDSDDDIQRIQSQCDGSFYLTQIKRADRPNKSYRIEHHLCVWENPGEKDFSQATVWIANSHNFYHLIQSYYRIFVNQSHREEEEDTDRITMPHLNMVDLNKALSLLRQYIYVGEFSISDEAVRDQVCTWICDTPQEELDTMPARFDLIVSTCQPGDLVLFRMGTIRSSLRNCHPDTERVNVHLHAYGRDLRFWPDESNFAVGNHVFQTDAREFERNHQYRIHHNTGGKLPLLTRPIPDDEIRDVVTELSTGSGVCLITALYPREFMVDNGRTIIDYFKCLLGLPAHVRIPSSEDLFTAMGHRPKTGGHTHMGVYCTEVCDIVLELQPVLKRIYCGVYGDEISSTFRITDVDVSVQGTK